MNKCTKNKQAYTGKPKQTSRKNRFSILIRPPVQSSKTARTHHIHAPEKTVQAGRPGNSERVWGA